jgi:hypothetical protein
MAASRFGSDMPRWAPVGWRIFNRDTSGSAAGFTWPPRPRTARAGPYRGGMLGESLAESNDGSIAEVVRGGRRASQTGWAP